MPPLNKHSPLHPTNIEKSAPGAYQGFTISDSKKCSNSNPLVVQNFQDKAKIAERKTSARGIFPIRIHFSQIMFAVHLTLLQLNVFFFNFFQFALVCVFSTYEEKGWGCQICLN